MGVYSSQSSNSINVCIRKILHTLQQRYHTIFFDCILTDNGSEFKSLHHEEQEEESGELFFKLFFCDPYSSFQKGGCERNHELLRYVYQKKKTLDTLTQEEVSEAFSHMNSLRRKTLKGRSSYQAFTKKFKIDPIIFGISKVAPEDIKLKK